VVHNACCGQIRILDVRTVYAVEVQALVMVSRGRSGGSRCRGEAASLIGLAYHEILGIQNGTIHAIPLSTVIRSLGENARRSRFDCIPVECRVQTAAFLGRGTFFVGMTTSIANAGITIIPGGCFDGNFAFVRVEGDVHRRCRTLGS